MSRLAFANGEVLLSKNENVMEQCGLSCGERERERISTPYVMAMAAGIFKVRVLFQRSHRSGDQMRRCSGDSTCPLIKQQYLQEEKIIYQYYLLLEHRHMILRCGFFHHPLVWASLPSIRFTHHCMLEKVSEILRDGVLNALNNNSLQEECLNGYASQTEALLSRNN